MILSCYITWCTKHPIHLITSKQVYVNQDRYINFLIKQIIVGRSIHNWSAATRSRCTRLSCSHPHLSKPHRLSLLSPAILSLFKSPSFGHLKSLNNQKKTLLLLVSKTLVGFHQLCNLIFLEKGCVIFGHSKLQIVDSLSLAINDHQYYY